jgi:hypothetical protein
MSSICVIIIVNPNIMSVELQYNEYSLQRMKTALHWEKHWHCQYVNLTYMKQSHITHGHDYGTIIITSYFQAASTLLNQRRKVFCRTPCSLLPNKSPIKIQSRTIINTVWCARCGPTKSNRGRTLCSNGLARNNQRNCAFLCGPFWWWRHATIEES